MTDDLHTQVTHVLHNLWDPIGIRDEPKARGEYEAYAPAVMRLLRAQATVQRVTDHLLSIERDRMGLAGDPARAAAVAQMLTTLRT